MIEGFEYNEIAILAAAAMASGVVRGFAGFGTAMIYLPFAGWVLGPFAALTTIVCFDLISPLPTVPRAWRVADLKDIARLGVGLVIGLPIGLYFLSMVPPEIFRYSVSILALLLLMALIGGVRYRGILTRKMVFGTGGLSGLMMGVAGLPGPPVILLYMARPIAAHVIRANTLLYLVLTDIVMIPTLAAFGKLETTAVLLGIFLIIPALVGILIGSWLFHPGYERLYRGVAYAVIATSAVMGLPIWDG